MSVGAYWWKWQTLHLILYLGMICSVAKSDVEGSCYPSEEDSGYSRKFPEKLPNGLLSDWVKKATRKTVGIVGGGVSGLGALKTLNEGGMKDIILFEAQNKLGGRVQTYRNGNVSVEDGAEWIHGGPKNIVYDIALKLNGVETALITQDDFGVRVIREDGEVCEEDKELILKLESIIDDTWENGVLEDYYGQGYGKYFIDRFENEIALGKKSRLLDALLHFIEQKVNEDEGTCYWEDISARDADAYKDLGDDYKWKNGYDTLINHLTELIPSSCFRLSSPITRIIWDLEGEEPGVLLVTEDNQFFVVDHLIVTISVGFLKKHHRSMFSPSIPLALESALNGISLGGPNKIFIGWPFAWWGNGPMMAKILWTTLNLTSDMDWLYGIVQIANVEGERLTWGAFISGEYSAKMEALNEDVVKADLLHLIRQLFRSSHIPEPTFFRRTRWNANKWTYGSYSSYITIDGDKSGLHSRSPFRKPLVNKNNNEVVRWAGEYTHDTRYGTVDGALQSGIREAKEVLRHYH